MCSTTLESEIHVLQWIATHAWTLHRGRDRMTL
jgi:hypothetical protein